MEEPTLSELVSIFKRMDIDTNGKKKEWQIRFLRTIEPQRSEFAKAALIGLLSNEEFKARNTSHMEILTTRAFMISDMMISNLNYRIPEYDNRP